MIPSLDGWSTATIVLFLVAAVYGVRLIKQRIDEQRYQERMADLEFEQSLLSGVTGSDASQDAVFLQTDETVAAMDSEHADLAVADPKSDPASDGPVPADVAASGIIAQLTHAGLLKNIDGYIPLYANPKGIAILRLKSGKTALLVPHVESEQFIRHNARRADMIIFKGDDGKGMAITPLETVLADNISPR